MIAFAWPAVMGQGSSACANERHNANYSYYYRYQ
jgi:hypothetical protein